MQNIVDKKRELIGIVNSAINKAPLPEVKDWEKAFTILKRHSLGSIFYIAVKDSDKVPKEIKEKAKSHFTAQTAQQMSQDYYTDVIYREFTKRKIKFMPIKGKRLRSLYPMPEMRTSCDVDVFYDKTRKEEVFSILKNLGFRHEEDGGNHSRFSLGNISIEVHHEIAYENDNYRKIVNDVWNVAHTSDGIRYDFSNEDFYIYYFVHTLKHFMNGGFGLRTLLDIYIYRKHIKVDAQKLEVYFEKLNMYQFVDALEKLALNWFGGVQTCGDETLELLGEFVLNNATYGSNKLSTVIQGAQISKKTKSVKLVYLFKSIFPSYKTMKGIYKILVPLPFLLPFAWVYKWFEVLFTRRHKFNKIIKDMRYFKGEEMENIQKIIEITGLGK